MAVAQKKVLSRTARQRIGFYLWLTPAIIGFCLLTAYPMFRSLFLSFTNYEMGGFEWGWNGFENYSYLLSSSIDFWIPLRNSLLFALCSVVLTNVLALLVAHLLTQDLVGTRGFRTLFYLPSILPAVATVIMFGFLFDANGGIINTLLFRLGVPRDALPGWLNDEGWAMPVIILINCWGFGGKMIIYISGLNAIPQDYYEAARIDGASGMRIFYRITIPLLMPSIVYNVITAIIGGIQVFTEGAVATNSVSFFVVRLYEMAYTGGDLSTASAMAWLLFIIVAVLAGGNYFLSKRFTHYEND